MIRAKKLVNYPLDIPENQRGRGVNIAFLDSGISKHPDISGRIVAFKDFVNGKEFPYDDIGHGTHVCGIAAGNGKASGGLYAGIAPEAGIIMAKVLNNRGDGNSEDMLAAIDWLLELKKKLPFRILNISIGTKCDSDGSNGKLLMEAVERAWAADMVVICATGNNGPMAMSLTPMSMSKKTISIGCHDEGYHSKSGYCCEDYSGRGPSKYDLRKPDLVAPGTDIMSCFYKYTGNSRKYKPYIRKSGTSMATPIVSGAVALLLSKYPLLTNEEVKQRLLYSARDLNEIWTKQGWGMLDIKKLLNMSY